MSKPIQSNFSISTSYASPSSAPPSTSKPPISDSRPMTSATSSNFLSVSTSKAAIPNTLNSPHPPTRASQPSGQAWKSTNFDIPRVSESLGTRLARQIRDKVAIEELGPEVRRHDNEIEEDLRKSEKQRRDEAVERVRTLARRISSLPESALNDSLLELCSFVKNLVLGTPEANESLKAIWDCSLYQVILVYTKNDFTYIKGGWKTGLELCILLSKLGTLLSGILSENVTDFHKRALQETVDQIILSATRLLDAYRRLRDRKEHTKAAPLTEDFNAILLTLFDLISAVPTLNITVLRSPSFMSLMCAEEPDVCVPVYRLLCGVLRVRRESLAMLDEPTLTAILEELIFDVACALAPQVGSEAIRCLLEMCDCLPTVIDTINSRYKSTRLILSRWIGRGAGRELQRLVMLLEAGTAERAQYERQYKAATKIQSLWRMYVEKRRLARANASIAKFQRAFRERREVVEKREAEAKAQAEMQFLMQVERRRRVRDQKFRHLQLLQTLRSDQVHQAIQGQLQSAARRIQSGFRGYRERKLLASGAREDLERRRAAIVIQRAVRRWLPLARARRHMPPAYSRPPGLTEARRAEIRNEVDDWKQRHPVKLRSDLELRDFHEEVQDQLGLFVANCRNRRRRDIERNALLARLEADSQLLLDAPKLPVTTSASGSTPAPARAEGAAGATARAARTDSAPPATPVPPPPPALSLADALLGKKEQPPITLDTAERFSTYSHPIQLRAKQMHNEELRRLRDPQWKRLLIDPEEDDLEFINPDEERLERQALRDIFSIEEQKQF